MPYSNGAAKICGFISTVIKFDAFKEGEITDSEKMAAVIYTKMESPYYS